MSKVEDYMHSRLGDFVNVCTAYISAVQALADAKEQYHNLLFAPEHTSNDVDEFVFLEKRTDYLLREVQHAAMNLSDFVVEYGHDLYRLGDKDG